MVEDFFLQIKKPVAQCEKTPRKQRKTVKRGLDMDSSGHLPESQQWHVGQVSTPTKFRWQVRKFAEDLADETPAECPYRELDRVEVNDTGDHWEAAVLRADL